MMALVARFSQIAGYGWPEFDPTIWGCEVPVGFGVISIAIVLPGGDFVAEGSLVGDAPRDDRMA